MNKKLSNKSQIFLRYIYELDHRFFLSCNDSSTKFRFLSSDEEEGEALGVVIGAISVS